MNAFIRVKRRFVHDRWDAQRCITATLTGGDCAKIFTIWYIPWKCNCMCSEQLWIVLGYSIRVLPDRTFLGTKTSRQFHLIICKMRKSKWKTLPQSIHKSIFNRSVVDAIVLFMNTIFWTSEQTWEQFASSKCIRPWNGLSILRVKAAF